MMMRTGLRLWLGLKVMTILAAVHLAYMVSSQFKVMGLNLIGLRVETNQFVKAAQTTGTTLFGMASSALKESPPVYESQNFLGKSDKASSSSNSNSHDRMMTQASIEETRPLKWALFTPPKPFSKAPHQYVALNSWLSLRIPPQVFMFEAEDMDPKEMEKISQEYGVQTLRVKKNSEGLLLQDAIFERASMQQEVDVVVVLNSDIILGDDFIDALELSEKSFDRFLLVGARYDNLVMEDLPVDANAAWVDAYRKRTVENGALHTYGGSDYFAWRPVGHPAMSAIGGRIPPFTYARGKADNWIVQMAMENGVVQVIDGSTAVVALHPAHGYSLSVTVPDDVAAAGQAAAAAEVQQQQQQGGEAQAEAVAAIQAAPSQVTETERHRRLQQQQGAAVVTEAEAKQQQLPMTAAVSSSSSSSKSYVNYWSAKSAGDPHVDMNKYLAYSFGSYLNGEGTPLHAGWQMMRCMEPDEEMVGGGLKEKACLRRRQRPGACMCENNAYVAKTLTEVELVGKHRVCGKTPHHLREEFEDEFVFRGLVSQQAEDGTVILIGFNNGYQDMLLNMVCRLQQLGISNYVIAAFDSEAFAFCRSKILPCFPVSVEVAKGAEAHLSGSKEGVDATSMTATTTTSSSSPSTPGAAAVDHSSSTKKATAASAGASSSAQSFGTKGFRALTKIKSQQVLRILQLGVNVMWSDVDIFWKVNTIPGVLAEMENADIGVQSNAPPEEIADNGRRRINSGFYYVKSTEATIQAFQQIVDHARQSTLSEQPSFYTVLCGDDLQYTSGLRDCVNPEVGVMTRLLSRQVYPNGAMRDVVKGVTPTSVDKVAIVHFNWLQGHDAKVESHVKAKMWLLDENLTCMYDSSPSLALKEKEGRKGEEESRPHYYLHGNQALLRRRSKR